MADPWLERAQRVLSDPNLDPSKRAALEAKVQARQASSAAPAPGGIPLRQGGAPMPEVDPYELDIKAAEASMAPAAQERLPDTYYPVGQGAGSGAAILYRDQEGDEGWRRAMDRADAEGRPAYRVDKVWPLPHAGGALNPFNWMGEPGNALMHAGLNLASFGSGVDKSLTLGAGQKLAGMGAEAAGLKGGDAVTDEAMAGAPMAAIAGRVAGALPRGGAAGRIGAGATRLLGAPSAGLIGSTIGASASGALGGAAQAGGEAAVEGGDIAGAALEGGQLGAILGPFANLVGRGADWMRRSLRDPATSTGRDLARAETAGAKTDIVSGIKPSPAMEQLADEGRAAGGYSPEAMAVRKAAPMLGEELAAQQNQVLGAAREGNEAIYAQGAQTSAQPVLSKALGALKDATHSDGGLLPGTNVRGVAEVAKRAANARVVPRTDPAAAAAGENTMDVGLARKLGIISRGTQAADGEMVVILEPKQVTAKDIDVMTRAFDDLGAVGSGVDKLKARPFRGLGAAAREAREGLGPDVADAKAQQSQQLNQMGNAMEAAGLPRRAEGIDLNDIGTRNALEGGVRRFRTDTNLSNDMELERVAHMQRPGTPTVKTQLGEALDLAAGTGAMQRVKNAADLKLAVGQGGAGLPAAAWTGMRLRLDPIMGPLGGIQSSGAVPAATQLARQLRRR